MSDFEIKGDNMNNVTIEFEGQKLVVDPNRLLSIVEDLEAGANLNLATRLHISQLLRKVIYSNTEPQTPYFLK